jgi:hypothetical protein
MDDNWIDFKHGKPLKGERVLVTDGDVVVIACFIDENSCSWIFDDHEHAQGGFEIQYWQSLPHSKRKPVLISAEVSMSLET